MSYKKPSTEKELKPKYWAECLPDKDLHNLLCDLLQIMEQTPVRLERVVNIEKRYAPARDVQLSRKIMSLLMESVPMVQRFIEKLEKNYLSKYTVLEYRQRIALALDKSKEITIRENLGRSTK